MNWTRCPIVSAVENETSRVKSFGSDRAVRCGVAKGWMSTNMTGDGVAGKREAAEHRRRSICRRIGMVEFVEVVKYGDCCYVAPAFRRCNAFGPWISVYAGGIRCQPIASRTGRQLTAIRRWKWTETPV